MTVDYSNVTYESRIYISKFSGYITKKKDYILFFRSLVTLHFLKSLVMY